MLQLVLMMKGEDFIINLKIFDIVIAVDLFKMSLCAWVVMVTPIAPQS